MNRFDIEAKNWDKKPNKEKENQKIIEKITPYLKQDFTVIDYGTGTGNLACGVHPMVKKIFAIDTSSGMLEVLKEKLEAQKIENIEVIQKDIMQESVASPVDLIMTSMTIHHIQDIKTLFKHFSEHLKPQGYLIIIDLFQEDGHFHQDNSSVAHFGFSESFIHEQASLAKLNMLDFQPLFEIQKADKNYGVFIAIMQNVCN